MVPGALVRYDSNIETTPWVAALAQQSSVEVLFQCSNFMNYNKNNKLTNIYFDKITRNEYRIIKQTTIQVKKILLVIKTILLNYIYCCIKNLNNIKTIILLSLQTNLNTYQLVSIKYHNSTMYIYYS